MTVDELAEKAKQHVTEKRITTRTLKNHTSAETKYLQYLSDHQVTSLIISPNHIRAYILLLHVCCICGSNLISLGRRLQRKVHPKYDSVFEICCRKKIREKPF